MKIGDYSLYRDRENNKPYLVEVGSTEVVDNTVDTPEKMNDFIRLCYDCADIAEEEMYAVYSDIRNKVIGTSMVAKGSVKAVDINIRGILIRALLLNAVGVTLVHNHPSKGIRFSTEDIKVTNKMRVACEYLELKFLDHIIIGGDKYASARMECVLHDK